MTASFIRSFEKEVNQNGETQIKRKINGQSRFVQFEGSEESRSGREVDRLHVERAVSGKPANLTLEVIAADPDRWIAEWTNEVLR